MVYDVIDISRYIINYSYYNDSFMSNLKLQKILYFLQTYYLISSKGNKYCFYDNIEAWDFGPVVPRSYKEFEHFGSGTIPYIKSYLIIEGNSLWDIKRVKFDDKIIKRKDKKMINKLVDYFSDYSATSLVLLTQKQKPWIDAFNSESKVISREVLYEYFK